ncbi:NAD(P)-binding protein [Nemania abortiva]|nr:NAD(P)-binding protein [Nemania abortiva]
MKCTFDISPERRASKLHFFYRQLFVTPPPVSVKEFSLAGKTAIVTGSNGGLGLETARQLLELRCKVILAVRDESKGERAREELARGYYLEPDSIQVWKLDLASYDSCIDFVDRTKKLDNLNIAILNAGLFKINYLSTMLLAALLLPVIRDRKSGPGPGHLVIVSSDTSAWVKFDERHSDPLLPAFKKKAANWDMSERYGTSKLLGQLFLTELAWRVRPAEVVVSCANPGFCRGSNLGRQAGSLLRIPYIIFLYFLGRKCTVGARTCVHAAAALGEDAHGQYVEDAKIQPMPSFVYTTEGQRVAKMLYEETLTELSFAGVRRVLEQLL